MEWLKRNWYFLLPIVSALFVIGMIILIETNRNDSERLQTCITVHFNQSEYDTKLVQHCEKLYQDWRQEVKREKQEMDRRNIEEMMEDLQ